CRPRTRSPPSTSPARRAASSPSGAPSTPRPWSRPTGPAASPGRRRTRTSRPSSARPAGWCAAGTCRSCPGPTGSSRGARRTRARCCSPTSSSYAAPCAPGCARAGGPPRSTPPLTRWSTAAPTGTAPGSRPGCARPTPSCTARRRPRWRARTASRCGTARGSSGACTACWSARCSAASRCSTGSAMPPRWPLPSCAPGCWRPAPGCSTCRRRPPTSPRSARSWSGAPTTSPCSPPCATPLRCWRRSAGRSPAWPPP
ncbi:MAG: Leucyl/phenylalanyl-tRNA--protein transferase, partial [uncultured Frankineae bacterium]